MESVFNQGCFENLLSQYKNHEKDKANNLKLLNEKIIGQRKIINQINLQNDDSFYKHLADGHQKLSVDEGKKYALQVQSFFRKLEEEKLPKRKRNNPRVLARRKKREESLKCLFEDREKIMRTPFQNPIFKRFGWKEGVKIYAFERTDVGVYIIPKPGLVIGEGMFKKGKLIYELFSNKFFLRMTTQNEGEVISMMKEPQIQGRFKKKELVEFKHSYFHRSKKGFTKCVMIFEFCNAGNLEVFILKHRGKKLTNVIREQLKHILHDDLLGLVILSREGVFHRDLKPANILLNEDEKGKLEGKIGDFGHALLKEGETTVGGTPLYMTPDRFIRKFQEEGIYFSEMDFIPQDGLDSLPKNDLWSFGLIIYEILLGSVFYYDLLPDELGEDSDSDNSEEIDQEENLKILLDLVNALDQKKIIDQCMRKEFSHPFEKGLQNFLRQILILNHAERPNAEEAYRLYCNLFKLPIKI